MGHWLLAEKKVTASETAGLCCNCAQWPQKPNAHTVSDFPTDPKTTLVIELPMDAQVDAALAIFGGSSTEGIEATATDLNSGLRVALFRGKGNAHVMCRIAPPECFKECGTKARVARGIGRERWCGVRNELPRPIEVLWSAERLPFVNLCLGGTRIE